MIGLGRIGTLVDRKAYHGFGMKVIGYDSFVPADKSDPCIERVESQDEVLRNADYVSVHIPSLPSTKRAFGQKQFEMMKKTAYFINCARGEIMDEEALYSAIQNGEIKGAGLDCFNPEPPMPDNPLLTDKRVICTPHNAAHTQEALDRMSLYAAMGIVDVLNGCVPAWPVNHIVE